MRAVLKKPALLLVIMASIETFKKESFVSLLGHKKNNDFLIETAFPHQVVKHQFSGSVAERWDLILGLNTLLWKKYQVIGFCHSHPEFGQKRYDPNPSKQDVEIADDNNVYMIVGISTKKKIQTWQKTKTGGILGTWGKYRFEINAFWAPEDKKLEQIPLICPSAYRLNAFKK